MDGAGYPNGINKNLILKIPFQVPQQNEIFELLIQQQSSTHIPLREIPVFDGVPLKFSLFMLTFKHCVEGTCAPKGDRMYYREQHTRGRPRALALSCLHDCRERIGKS